MELLQSIISSKMRIKLLRFFIQNSERRYYLREISKMIKGPITPIRRELINLMNVGFLRRYRVANLIYYSVNADFLLYEEFKSIVEKTDNLASK